MDYEAEQQMEIEALEAIFVESLEKYSGTVPDGWNADAIYRVTLKPMEEDEKLEMKMALDFLFAYTPMYPDEVPHFRIQSSYGLSDQEVSEIQSVVEEEVQLNLGMAMMFHIFDTIKEWLRNRANVDTSFSLTEEEKKRLKEEEEEKRMAEQRSHGIPVTLESFLEWKLAFDAEMQQNSSRQHLAEQDPRLAKLTGKDLFLQRLAEDDKVEENEVDDEEDYDDDDDDEEWTDVYLEQNA